MPYILLSSASQDQQATRSFTEYATKAALAQTIINYFEDYLQVKSNDDGEPDFQYSSDEMFHFVDTFFGELVCLEKQEDHTDLWIPYSTSWVKEAIYLFLRSQCPAEHEERQHEADSMEVDERSEIVIN